MLLVELDWFEEWRPLLLVEGGQLLDSLAFLDNIVTKWPFSILICLIVLDYDESGPIDAAIILSNLIHVDGPTLICIAALIRIVTLRLLAFFVLIADDPHQPGPQLRDFS